MATRVTIASVSRNGSQVFAVGDIGGQPIRVVLSRADLEALPDATARRRYIAEQMADATVPLPTLIGQVDLP